MNVKTILGSFGFGLLLAAAPLFGAPMTPGGEDPIDLFAKLMPVFSHDRCVNCHGGVDPFVEENNDHSGGILPQGATCHNSGCHSATDGVNIVWTTAPPRMSFVGKDTKQMCELQSPEARRRRPPQDYLHHLTTDALIDLAFEGRSAGASDTAEPPPMKKIDFLTAARAWLDAGAGCGGWVGTITQEETFHSNYVYPIKVGKGPSTTAVDETAKRTVTITRQKGATTARSEMSGHQTIRIVMRDVGPNGPCTSTALSDQDWNGHFDGEATVRVKIEPDGSYVIRFAIPMEKTNSGANTISTGDCGPNPPNSPPEPVELEWSARTFFIEDKLQDPRDRQRLVGSLSRPITPDGSRASKSHSWLAMSPAGVARADSGEPIPIDVRTTWDLKLEE